MLEIDAGSAARLRGESDVDLARLLEVGLVAPLVRDLPREHEAVGRIPHEHAAPVAFAVVGLDAVASSAFAGLDDALLHRDLADVMRPGPPRVMTLGEHAERVLHTGVDRDRLPNRRDVRYAGHRSSFRDVCSAIFLNASSASVQKRSKYARSASMPPS